MKYELEIYEPNSKLDTLQNFISNSPFMPVSKGEILNPAFFSGYSNNPGKILRVTQVEHIIFEAHSDVVQKILVFTEEIDNKPESRN